MAVRNLLLLAAISNLGGVLAAPSGPIQILGAGPAYTTDPDASSYCSWWFDNDGSLSCEEIADAWYVTWDDLVR
jgi:hypothetical protein